MHRLLNKSRAVGRTPRGFSLIEVLIAMFVIAVSLLGVMSALFWGTQHSDSGKVMTEASNLARTITEGIRIQGLANLLPPELDDAPAVRKAIDDPPLQSVVTTYLSSIKGQTGTNTENTQSEVSRFRRNISVERLTGGDTHSSGLATLTVRIYWDEKGAERRAIVETIIPVSPP